MNTKKTFDTETKKMLLKALQRGYFIDTDTDILAKNGYINTIKVIVRSEETKTMLENMMERE
jgi:hypothetical protein